MKKGLVLEGGAYRGIFTTGVLNVIRKNNVDFQYIAGVSAGAGNIADFVSGRDAVSKNFIAVCKKHNSVGFKQLVKSGYILNVDAMAKELMTVDDNEIADSIMHSPIDIEIVCSNCLTGRPEYLFERKSIRKLIEIGKASCSVPIISKPTIISGVPYLDGSITDAVPVRRALDNKKCDKAVVIFTRPSDETPTNYRSFMPAIKAVYGKKYPAIVNVLYHRLENYYKEMEYIEEMERRGRVFVIRPSIKSIERFEISETKIRAYYIHGIDTMEAKIDALKDFLEIGE